MQDYLENAYRKAQEMELENVRFHSEMQRFEFINKAISNALLIYAGCHAVLACSSVSINQPSSKFGNNHENDTTRSRTPF